MYVGTGLGVGEVGVAATGLADGEGLGAAGKGGSDAEATALADGEGLSAAGTGRPHELLMSTTTSADTTSLMDIERCRHSFRFGSACSVAWRF